MSSVPIDPRLARTVRPFEFFGGCSCIACAAIREFAQGSSVARRVMQSSPGRLNQGPSPEAMHRTLASRLRRA